MILFAYSIFLILETRNILYRDLDDELRIKVMEIATIINQYQQINRKSVSAYDLMEEFFYNDRFGAGQRRIVDEIWQSQVKTLNLNKDYMNIMNGNGNSLLISGNFESVRDIFSKMKFSAEKLYYLSAGDRNNRLRIVNYPIIFRNKVHLIIQLGTPLSYISKILLRMLLYMVISALLLVTLTSFIGRYIVSRILKPVNMVAERANSISVSDLSKRVEMEKVEDEMRALINSFNDMLRKLESSFKHINDFSSHVAHEIKTPLSIIKGELDLALKHERSTGEYRRVLSSLSEEVERIRKIIIDLLLLSKCEYDQSAYKYDNVNVVNMLKELYEEARMLAVPKQISVSFNYSKEDVYISGDLAHLRRLFLNLISNAIKYTGSRGNIAISLKKSAGEVRVAVADNGEGISKENLAKIFDKFFRAKRDGSQAEAGTGLGLSIARSIATAHRGSIEVESEMNKGTTFTVILPAVDIFASGKD